MATADEIKIRIIARDEASKVFKQTEKSLGGMKTAAKAASAALLAIGSSQALRSFVQISARFESMRKSLITVTGSAGAANQAFALITKSAQEMPFSVQEITASFIKMRSLGIEPTEEVLKSFANTASATGKSFDQFAEAVADAMTGEFERLKEFGIKSAVEGEKVSFTFQGLTTTVGKNSEEIVKYLQSIGEVQFAGAAVDQMDTLSGSFSNFGDAIDQVVIAFGELDAVKDIVNSLAEGLRELSKWIRMTGDPKNIQNIDELNQAINNTEVAIAKAKIEAEKYAKLVDETDPEAGIFSSAAENNVAKLEYRLKGLYDQLAKVKEESTIQIGGGKKDEKKEGTFWDGYALGVDNYTASIKTLDVEAAKAAEGGLKSIEDNLVDMAMGTKSAADAFKDMARSIIADIMRIYIRQQILGTVGGLGGGSGITGMLSGLGGSLFGGYQAETFVGATPFAGGGYTGNGARSGGMDGKGGFPAILHPQETVIDHAQGQQMPGGALTVNFNINAIDTQTGTQFLLANKPSILGMVQQAYNRRGQRGFNG